MDTATSTSSSLARASTAGPHDSTRLASVRHRQGQHRRRSSSLLLSANNHLSACTPLQLPFPPDSQGLDLRDASPLYALASLRFLVLSYLADLEQRLTQFDFDFDLELDLESKSKALETWKLHGEHKFQEAKASARTGLEMLNSIRADVYSHFPDLPMTSSLEGLTNFKSRFPDVSAVPMPDLENMRSNLPDIRSHLPDVSTLPDMSLPESVRAHLPISLSETVRNHLPGVNMHMPTLPDLHIRDLQSGMDDVLSELRHKISEIDFHQPFKFIPTLSQSLENLHYHLSSMSSTDAHTPSDLPKPPIFEFTPNSVLADLLESLLQSDVVKEILASAPEVIQEGEEILERTALEVSEALEKSLRGMKLINYWDLPHPWRNNPFVTHGYRCVGSKSVDVPFLINPRFIPIDQWSLIIRSLFAWHNETRRYYLICHYPIFHF